MFLYCDDLSNIYDKASSSSVFQFDLTNVKDASIMFQRCSKLSVINLSETHESEIKTHTSNFSDMFKDCSSLTNIIFGDNFDTKRVKKMSNMFIGCKSLTGKLGESFFECYGNITTNWYAGPYISEDKKGYFTLKENTSDEIIIGDYVVDGKFNIQDLLALRDALASGKTFTTDELQRINVDGIPGFTINDLISLMVRFANTL